MPGRLIMDQQGAVGPHDLKKDRAQAQAANLPPKPDFAQKQSAPAVSVPENHIVNGSLPNGAPNQGQHPPTTNGDVSTGTFAASDPQSPPPLDHSWQQGHSNKSMGTLIERLAQKCFEDLNGTLSRMAETPADSSNGLPNSVPTQAVDTSEASLSKKRTFMEFAQGQRDRFIKTLVLSDWARNSEDMSRLIDLKVMFDHRSAVQRHVIGSIAHIKHDVNRIKVPNPNIDLAMELLATGKASKAPTLGYIPAKKLSAKETLSTLRNMNVLLATRLNLHEELPPHFTDFTIANGKATFRVPDEFEVDLAIADEDLTSPFYFINMRFTYSPSPGEVREALLEQLEMRANELLASKGLQGCYDFLHNFVLTHKINTLHDQARQMERERWFGCVSIQKSRRVLTVQYWREVPGKKNWIEIAVSTGKQPGRQSRRAPTPRLSIRWFRRGELVPEHGMEFDWKNLSLERILRAFIAKHVLWILDATKQRLQNLAGVNSKLKMDLQSPVDSPEDSNLTLSLPMVQTPLTLKLETVTGRFSLSPATLRSADMEMRLNKQPDLDLGLALTGLICNAVKDRVDRAAELAGWSLFREPIRQESIKAALGMDVTSFRAFIPNRAWASQGAQWAIFPTFSLAGHKWWVVRLENRPNPNPSQNANAKVITMAREIPVHTIFSGDAKPVLSRRLLLQIEDLAVAEVSFAVLSQQLTSDKIPHRVQKTVSLTGGGHSAIGSIPTSAMLIQTKGLIKTQYAPASLIDTVKITNQGFITEGLEGEGEAEMGHELRMTVEPGKLDRLSRFLKHKPQNADIAMTENGGLAMRLRTPFGQPFFEQVKDLVESRQRLDNFLSVIVMHRMQPTAVSTTKFSFVYNQALGLQATMTFRKPTGKLEATLKLEPSASNPQQRLRVNLEKLLNTPAIANNFAVLVNGLQYTLPVMQLFERLEAADSTGQGLSIVVRDAFRYRMTYRGPLPEWAFDVHLRIEKKQDGSILCAWRIGREKALPRGEMASTAFGRALLDFTKHKDGDWMGLEDGTILAGAHAGGIALDAVDKFMRGFREGNDNAPKQGEQQQKPAPGNAQKPAAPKANGNANGNGNAARNNSNNQSKVKKEVIELD